MRDQGETVSERVVRSVADNTNTDPLELPPLFDTVDPDALDALVRSLSDGELTFTYAGCAVTVDSTGAVELADREIGDNSIEESATGD